jgi:hypothetical protein
MELFQRFEGLISQLIKDNSQQSLEPMALGKLLCSALYLD